MAASNEKPKTLLDFFKLIKEQRKKVAVPPYMGEEPPFWRSIYGFSDLDAESNKSSSMLAEPPSRCVSPLPRCVSPLLEIPRRRPRGEIPRGHTGYYKQDLDEYKNQIAMTGKFLM